MKSTYEMSASLASMIRAELLKRVMNALQKLVIARTRPISRSGSFGVAVGSGATLV